MKKLLILILCITTLGLVSCKKDTIIDPGSGLPPNETIETVINVNNWQTVDGGKTYFVDVNFPEIDDATFTNDGLSVYMYPDNEVNEYRQLPYTYNSNSYSYTARQGSITIILQSSDVQDQFPDKPTVPAGLRVVIVTSTLTN